MLQRKTHLGFAIGLLVFLAAWSSHAQTVVISGADIIVSPKKRLTEASILIRDGKISKIAKSIAAPANAEKIDGKGMVVSVGLMDAYNVLGLVEVGMVESTREGQFSEGAVHAAYRVVDGYNPWSTSVDVARSGGLTSVVSVPQGGLISGVAAWMSLAHGKSVQELTLDEDAAMNVTLGRRSLGVGGGSRGRSLELLRELLADAKDFGKKRSLFDRNQTRKYAASRLDLAAILEASKKKFPMLVRADRASDISAALRLQRDEGVKLVIVGGTEAWLVAKELASSKVPVIVNPSSNLPESFDNIRVRNDNAAILRQAGVEVIISTLGDGAGARTLKQLAGIGVAYGMTWEDAFAAISSVPARVFGRPNEGVLKAGNKANLVLWNGDPLELSSRPLRMWIGGEEQSLESHQTRLRDRYLGGNPFAPKKQ